MIGPMHDRSAQFEDWLRTLGIEGSRRIVREASGVILVSKFEPGFAAHLHEAIDALPEMFDIEQVTERYRLATCGTLRPEAWRIAIQMLLADTGPFRGLDRDQLAEIQAGIDSVAALLDSLLWTGPKTGVEWRPSEAERQAYADALARMDAESGIFSRYYGEFEGVRVENHCPGAQVARRLFTQAWTVCTGNSITPEA